MLKQYLKDGAAYTFGDLLLRGLSFFLVPIYTRILSVQDYGIIDLTTAFASVVNVTVTFEITQAIARFYSDCEKEEDKIRYVSTAYWFTVFMETVFFIMAIAYQNDVERLIWGMHVERQLYVLMMMSIVVSGMYYFFYNQMRWCLYVKENVYANIINSLSTIIFSIVFLCVLDYGVKGIFLGQFIGGGLGIVWCHCYLYKYLYGKISLSALRSMLAFSLPLVLSSTMVMLANYVDRWSIKELMSLSSVGIYSIAAKFSSVASLIVGGACKAITPLIYKEYKNENTHRDIAKIFEGYIAVGFALCIIFEACIYYVLDYWVPKVYHGAAIASCILFLTAIASNAYVFFPGVFLNKKTFFVVLFNGIALINNCVLNKLFIPILGIDGAALATLITAIVTCGLYCFWGQREYEIPLAREKLIKGVVFFVIGNILLYALRNSIREGVIQSLFCCLVAVIISWLIVRSMLGDSFFKAVWGFMSNYVKVKV